jgi:hypothetical protein
VRSSVWPCPRAGRPREVKGVVCVPTLLLSWNCRRSQCAFQWRSCSRATSNRIANQFFF